MSVKGVTVFRLAWTAFVLVATSAPYLVNFFSTPSGYHYTWIIPPYPDDSFGYAAWAQQAAHGAWLFKIKFTAVPHAPFLFHPFFLICGRLSALFSCDVGTAFFAVKAIGVVLFFAVFYRYIDYLKLNTTASVVATILVGISSGLGGLFALAGWTRMSIFPADLWMPEMSTYWSLLWNPLFPFSLSLLLLSIYWLDRGSREGIAADFWGSGIANGVMALIHPYSVPFLLAFAAILTVVRCGIKSIGYFGRYLGSALPFLIYMFWVSQSNRLVLQHSVQGAMKSPHPIVYAIGFGLPLVFVAVGLVVRGKLLLIHYWHILVWFLLSAVLAFFPFWYQRKLVFGAHIALCILAAVVFDSILSAIASRQLRRIAMFASAIIFMPLLAVTPAYLAYRQRQEVKQNRDGAYYISDAMMEALRALRKESKPDEVTIALYSTSRLIAAFAGNTVVWGHWAMSIDLKERQKWTQKLFSSQADWSDVNRAAQFWGDNAQLLFADGPLKQSIELHPYQWEVILKGATKIFENASVVIYRRPADL